MASFEDERTRLNKKTVVQFYGKNNGSCGYCKVDNVRVGVSASDGLVSSCMKVTDYEKLMLQGWRRSGDYFYKPRMYETCCPQYTIRLNVTDFKISKSQRKVLRTFEQYLSAGQPLPESSTTESVSDSAATTVASLILTIETVRSSYTREKFDLYKMYQVAVHHDDPDGLSPSSFSNFLVSSPLVDNVTVQSRIGWIPNNERGYGTFHQEYRINNVLVGVGVLDILPSGASSVYFFYNPKYSDVCIGKYSALREIEYCQKNNLAYYYMGFYIHDCPKMNYKGQYSPSELLCPTTLTWYDLSSSKKYLDRNRFTPLNPSVAEEFLTRQTEGSEMSLIEYAPRLPECPESFWKDVTIEVGDDRYPMDGIRESGKVMVKKALTEAFKCFNYNDGTDFVYKMY